MRIAMYFFVVFMATALSANTPLIKSDLHKLVADLSAEYKVPVPLVRAIISVESSWDQFNYTATGSSPCYGLMQINYKVWSKTLGLTHPTQLYHAETNICAGIRIFKNCYKAVSGVDEDTRTHLALQKYYGKCKIASKYADKVMRIYEKERGYVKKNRDIPKQVKAPGHGEWNNQQDPVRVQWGGTVSGTKPGPIPPRGVFSVISGGPGFTFSSCPDPGAGGPPNDRCWRASEPDRLHVERRSVGTLQQFDKCHSSVPLSGGR